MAGVPGILNLKIMSQIQNLTKYLWNNCQEQSKVDRLASGESMKKQSRWSKIQTLLLQQFKQGMKKAGW